MLREWDRFGRTKVTLTEWTYGLLASWRLWWYFWDTLSSSIVLVESGVVDVELRFYGFNKVLSADLMIPDIGLPWYKVKLLTVVYLVHSDFGLSFQVLKQYYCGRQ
uniref:(northern house mosquito) hypothetical protein n=1 Tax=Culex pipiens TaxID=7175 RepID=A0A8D8C4Q6_CULPI